MPGWHPIPGRVAAREYRLGDTPTTLTRGTLGRWVLLHRGLAYNLGTRATFDTAERKIQEIEGAS